MLPKLCHLDNDLEIIIIIQYIYCVVHMTYIPYLGTFFFSRYPRVALTRICIYILGALLKDFTVIVINKNIIYILSGFSANFMHDRTNFQVPRTQTLTPPPTLLT